MVRAASCWSEASSDASGIYTRMVWTYYKHMKGDSRWLKAIVAVTALFSYGITGESGPGS